MLWMLLWPSLAGIVLGLAARLVLRRGAHRAAGSGVPAAAVGVAVVVMVVYPLLGAAPLWFDTPSGMWSTLSEARFALPLVLGLFALVLHGAMRSRPSVPGGASLAPRSWRSFLATWWLGALLGVLALIVGLTLAAGTASQPNDAGEHVLYMVDVGPAAMGTTIYGWHYSLVPSVLGVLLCLATWWSLSRIARPPLDPTRTADAADRRLRSTNAVRIALGALLLHLASILRFLADTSQLVGLFDSGQRLSFTTGTPFSALTGTLDVLALIAGILGLALWVFTVLTAVPAPWAARASTSVAS